MTSARATTHLPRTTAAAVASALVALGLLLACGAASAQGDAERFATDDPQFRSFLTLYRNGLGTSSDAREIKKYTADNCARGRTGGKMKVRVGQDSGNCVYRSPVFGRDVDVASTVILLSQTPPELKPHTALALTVRADRDGGGYRFELLPNRRSWKLTRAVKDGDGNLQRTVIAEGSDRTIDGTGERNRIRLRADGDRITGWLGSTVLVQYIDPDPDAIEGRATGFGIVSDQAIERAGGLFDSFTLRVPNPLG
ncbi:MAG: hypothetical protein ACR2NA_10975 [Solirubrobacterales bacterium]